MEETADRYNEVTGRTLGIGWYLKTLTHEVGMIHLASQADICAYNFLKIKKNIAI
jgi:hypothetical protein